MKTFFPPAVGFLVFAVIVLLYSFIYPMHLGDMGKGNLHAFMTCFYYCWPLYFLTALLTQGLITVPLWEAARGWGVKERDVAVIVSCMVCGVFAGGIAYIIWDRHTGYWHLAGLTFIMLLVQLAYWIINIFVLMLFGGKVNLKLKHEAKEAAE
jgi:hypothetical protein